MIRTTLATISALLAAGAAGAGRRRFHRSADAARQRHRDLGRGAGRRSHRQCRLGRADPGLPLARSRHHRRAAGRAGAVGAARQAGDRRDDRRHQGSPGHPPRPHARQQGPRNRGGLARSSAASALAMPPTSPSRSTAASPTCGSMPPTPARSQPVATRYDARSGRFDIAFEINNDNNPTPTKLRFTGTAIETVEVAVLTRDIDRADLLKSSDVALERRPKAEVTGEAASRDRTDRHAAPPADAGGHADPRRRHRQARLRVARPERHRHLPGPRDLPHHARQGARERRRGRHRERAQSPDQAHADRHRHRSRPGDDPGREPVRADGACGRADLLAQARRSAHPAAAAAALAQSLVQAPASPAQAAQAQIAQAQIPQVRVPQAPAKSE